MKFCDRCGTYMERTMKGFLCPKCKNQVSARALDVNTFDASSPNPVYVLDGREKVEYVRISHTCPRCGNQLAVRWFSAASGEHAGVKRERTVEHFRCTKCSFTWVGT